MITIVIPNYNGNKYLSNCIQSIMKQEYVGYEIIIIDNNSEDSNYKWVTEQYKEIEFISLDKNYGFSYAVNTGIKLAKGEYVLLLNNDTELTPSFLTEMLKVIETDKKIFGVSSKMIQYYNKGILDDAGDEFTVIGWAQKRGDGELISKYIKQQRVFSACAGAALYRREVFNKIGYFDEHFFAYLEDVDIGYRANIYGYKNVFAPDATVYHIGSATSGGGNSNFKIRLTGRNNIYLIYKNMPLLQLIINMPCLIVGHLARYCIFKRKGYGQAYIEGTREGLKTLKQVKKSPFRLNNINHYFYIEWILIKNTLKEIVWKRFIITKLSKVVRNR